MDKIIETSDTTNVQEAERATECPVAIIKRKDGQDFKEYKEQRAETNKMIRHFLKGILFHDTSISGTYDVGSKVNKRARYENHKLLTHKRKCNKRNKNNEVY